MSAEQTVPSAGKTRVTEASGLNRVTSESRVESTILRRPGVPGVQANLVAQIAKVTDDPQSTSVADLSGWVRDCRYYGDGQP